MLSAHPDRGGSDAAFINARKAYDQLPVDPRDHVGGLGGLGQQRKLARRQVIVGQDRPPQLPAALPSDCGALGLPVPTSANCGARR